jgi:hypothetical protein
MLLDKIDPSPIISDHLATLYDHGANRRSVLDIALFFGVPLIIAGIAVEFAGIRIRVAAVTAILTASALFIGLLPNLLVLVLSFLEKSKGDPSDTLLQNRKRLMREIAAHVSFAFVLSLTLASIATAALMMLHRDDQPSGPVLTFSLIAGSVCLFLTLLMLIRRMHVLIVSEFDLHKFGSKVKKTA